MTHVPMPDLVSQRAGLRVHLIATLETLEQSPQAVHLHLDQDLDEPRRRNSRLLARYEVRSGCPPPRIRSATSSTVEASPGCPRSATSTDQVNRRAGLRVSLTAAARKRVPSCSCQDARSGHGKP